MSILDTELELEKEQKEKKIAYIKEHKKLGLLKYAINNIEGIEIPYNIKVDNINPFMEYIKKRIHEIEEYLN